MVVSASTGLLSPVATYEVRGADKLARRQVEHLRSSIRDPVLGSGESLTARWSRRVSGTT